MWRSAWHARTHTSRFSTLSQARSLCSFSENRRTTALDRHGAVASSLPKVSRVPDGVRWRRRETDFNGWAGVGRRR